MVQPGAFFKAKQRAAMWGDRGLDVGSSFPLPRSREGEVRALWNIHSTSMMVALPAWMRSNSIGHSGIMRSIQYFAQVSLSL